MMTSSDLFYSLAFEGKLVVLGFASGDIPKVPTNLLLLKSSSVMGLYWGNYSLKNPAVFLESISEVLKYTAEGRIKPHISMEAGIDKVSWSFGECFEILKCFSDIWHMFLFDVGSLSESFICLWVDVWVFLLVNLCGTLSESTMYS